MKEELETRNVFLDTQAFVQQGLKFEGKALSRVHELGESRLVSLFISEVVNREVSSKISEKISKAIKLRNDFQKELGILESSTPEGLNEALSGLEGTDLYTLGENRWKEYVLKSNFTILDPNTICNKELLELYFGGKYPFSEGKKKDEFPDAISLLSLMSWLKPNNEKVYVVSNDGDLKGFCETHDNLISVSHLTEFLDLYNRAEERLAEVIHRYIDKQTDYLSSTIKESFIECEFHYFDNWEAEVDNVEVKGLTVYEVDVIEVEDERAVINFRVEISCSADVSGPDYDNAMRWSNSQIHPS